LHYPVTPTLPAVEDKCNRKDHQTCNDHYISYYQSKIQIIMPVNVDIAEGAVEQWR